MKALEKLIQGTVDYAGLFPPAQLPLETVVKNFAQYSANNRRSMLGRLIIPAGKLVEFESVYDAHISEGNYLPWKISALLPPPTPENQTDFETALTSITDFHRRQAERSAPFAIVDSVEVKTVSPEMSRLISDSIPDANDAFLEVDWNQDPTADIEGIATIGKPNVRAKIRTGGVEENMIPSPASVARFLNVCSKFRVGLKATAGLHHPLRGRYRLTYEPDATTGTMHGFVNVLVAACFAFSRQEAPLDFLTEVLSSESADDFFLGDREIGFGDRRLDVQEIESIRELLFASFGSCSFDEPSEEIESAFHLAPA